MDGETGCQVPGPLGTYIPLGQKDSKPTNSDTSYDVRQGSPLYGEWKLKLIAESLRGEEAEACMK